MSTRKNKPPLGLDMEFGEALRRFANVPLSELPDSVRLKRTKRTNKPAPKPEDD